MDAFMDALIDAVSYTIVFCAKVLVLMIVAVLALVLLM